MSRLSKRHRGTVGSDSHENYAAPKSPGIDRAVVLSLVEGFDGDFRRNIAVGPAMFLTRYDHQRRVRFLCDKLTHLARLSVVLVNNLAGVTNDSFGLKVVHVAAVDEDIARLQVAMVLVLTVDVLRDLQVRRCDERKENASRTKSPATRPRKTFLTAGTEGAW